MLPVGNAQLCTRMTWPCRDTSLPLVVGAERGAVDEVVSRQAVLQLDRPVAVCADKPPSI